MLMKIFGLTNKSDRMSTKDNFFMDVILYFCVFVEHKKYEMYSNWTSKISLYM